MTLRETQTQFVWLLADFLKWIEKREGYEVTLGDAYRDPRLHGHFGTKKGYGARNSYHKLRCAIDLNLFVHGEWKPETESHRQLGEYWESLHPWCRWGGRFNDGNHYEFIHNGWR